MKRSMKLAVLATVTAGVLGGAALADSHKQRGEKRGDRAEKMFERMDADSNGEVTADEAKAFAAKRFGQRDIDGDGVVTRADRKASQQDRRAKRFDVIDADGDGMISKEEFASFTPDREKRREMRSERRGKGMHRGKGKRRGMRGPLTIQEAEARATRRFERIDSDGKGYITLDDIKEFRMNRKDRRSRH